ncbi:MAG TPA: putative holin [Roseateles sp.]
MKTQAPTSRKTITQRAVARLRKPPRLTGWMIFAVALLVLVWAIRPQQLSLSIYKLSLVTLAGVVGYWLDRQMFPYARPDAFLPDTREALEASDLGELGCTLLVAPEDAQLRLAAAAMHRRAIIVAAAMLSMALGA